MHAFFRFVFLCTIAIFSHAVSLGQVNPLNGQQLGSVNVDQLSDNDVNGWYQEVSKSGIKADNAYFILSQKGLSEGEINKLKQRVNGLSLQKNKEEKGMEKSAQDEMPIAQEAPLKKEMEEIYGAELFSTFSTVFEPNLRIPAPAAYIIGPEDELIIHVFGYSEQTYQLAVSKEGKIYIPNVGPLVVAGLSMEKAELMIRSKLASTIYSALKSGKTDMQLTLGKIKSIRVSVIGEANRTGSFTVSSLTTAFNLLYLCGGPGKSGSYRTIEVIRGNNVVKKVDLYQFLLKGSQNDNILLQEGDIVRIPFREQTVLVNGMVKRPGKYEVIEGDNIASLLKYCGGYNTLAFRNSLVVTRIQEEGKKVTDVSASDFVAFNTKDGDEVTVNAIPARFLNRVTIAGTVARPGRYELDSSLDLKKLIIKSGGLLPEAFYGNVSVFRLQENRLPEVVSISLEDVMNNRLVFNMKNEDSIYIHSIFDFKEKFDIVVDGSVVKPGNVKWSDSISLSDVIAATGGLKYTADSNKIEVSRRIFTSEVSQSNHQESQRILVSMKDNIHLMPFDHVFVRSKSGIADQRYVMLLGEVKVPGRYVLERSQDRLSDLFNRADGFKSTADSISITIRRSHNAFVRAEVREAVFQKLLNVNMDSIRSNEKLKSEIFKDFEMVSVNRKKAMEKYESSDNLILEDGDVIIVEKNSKLVKISGEVNYPTIVTYIRGRHARYYIKQAGSFTSAAAKRRTVVIYPDGKAKSVKRFLFFKSNPKIKERSEIFIPPKAEKDGKKLSYGELALMVTSLGILANIVIAIIKL